MNNQLESIKNQIFNIEDDSEFEALSIEVFKFQYFNNSIYKKYVDLLNIKPEYIQTIKDIPFIPIEFFKEHEIILDGYESKVEFFSSGTTGSIQSKHLIANENIYIESFVKAFELFYGNINDYCFLALLPGYLERKGSSLIYMVNKLMELSNHPKNGFYLNELSNLADSIKHLKENEQKFMLFGVTYALLDFAEMYPMELSNGIIMETGGMKGKRKELIKTEIHSILISAFSTTQIHSEYGMTELLSQAYSKGSGLFETPSWMKILIRDTYDPYSYVEEGKSGGINVIDLANLYSCSFIETKDLGRKNKKGQFDVIGRFDNSDIRGCNLLVAGS